MIIQVAWPQKCGYESNPVVEPVAEKISIVLALSSIPYTCLPHVTFYFSFLIFTRMTFSKGGSSAP